MDKSLEKLNKDLSQEKDILAAAVKKTLDIYNENPTTANLRDYQANKKAYDDCIAKLDGKDLDFFNTKADVLSYLEFEGWDVKKSKLYKDMKHVPKTDGGYLKADVDMYAKLRLVKSNGAVVDMDSGEKTRQEIRVAAARAEKLEMENDIMQGKYILRAEVEQLHASKAQHLKTALQGFFQSQAAMIIETSEGDASRAADVREFCLLELAKFLNEYAKPCRYSVPLISVSEDREDNG